MNPSIAAPASITASKGRLIASWAIRSVLAAAFLAAGTAKLMGVPMMVQTFDAVGLGQWFRYVTGAVEIAGAIGLFLPRLTAPAALTLGLTMVGAVLAHLFVLPTTGIPAVVLAILAFIVMAIHRDQFGTLLAR